MLESISKSEVQIRDNSNSFFICRVEMYETYMYDLISLENQNRVNLRYQVEKSTLQYLFSISSFLIIRRSLTSQVWRPKSSNTICLNYIRNVKVDYHDIPP